MKEIDRDFYCSAAIYNIPASELPNCVAETRWQSEEHNCKKCSSYHRKFPTPKQFKTEYGREYPDDGAVYVADIDEGDNPIWLVTEYWSAKQRGVGKQPIICASTPWGKPPDNWRPE
jgi:hypothetical protein